MDPPKLLDYGPLDYQTPAPRARRSWFVPSKKERKVILAGLIVLGVLLVCGLVSILAWYLPFRENLRKAGEHAAKLEALVAGDARFNDVEFMKFTARNGVLLISGGVASQNDLNALQQIVADSRPPVRVMWTVKVLSGKTTRPVRVSFETP